MLLLVATQIITELIPERAGPVIFKNSLLEFIAFRLIPVIFHARFGKKSKAWKLLETIINSKRGLSRN